MDYKKAISDRKIGKTFFEGKEKMQLADVVEKYPDGLNLTGIYTGHGKFGEYVAFTCVEIPNTVIFAGRFFLDIVNEWLLETTLQKINEDFSANPILFKFEKKRTSNGTEYWEVQ